MKLTVAQLVKEFSHIPQKPKLLSHSHQPHTGPYPQPEEFIFMDQAIQKEFYLECLTPEDGTDRLSRNSDNQQSTNAA
jgi:hypothetical protein